MTSGRNERTDARIEAANELLSVDKVEGWVGDRIWHMIEFANHYHRLRHITGDIAEIGVHHGKLFFVLASACELGDRCVAMDIFERQDLNVDGSGSGSREIFDDNLKRLFPDLVNIVTVIAGDSMAVPMSRARSLISDRGVRVLSIDGGHTKAHVLNDLSIAQEIVNSGAIILLDDFFGSHWPSVTEGFFEFFTKLNRRLAPFMIFQNKLFLTTFSEHGDVLKEIRTWIESYYDDEIDSKWKYTTICGFSVLSHSV